jgi:tetratricopeptide (TPR) repeat protein
VESVAWISARKDVLSALFVFLTLAAYIRYARRGGIWRMALVALAFAAALMSKAIVVVLPLGLLLLDYWPLARMHAGGWTRLVLEKVPLLLLSLGSTIITIVFQRAEGIVMSTEVLPVPVRATNALISYAVYLWKTLWPMNLAYYYPHPFSLRLPAALLALLLLTALSALAWRTRRARPFLIVGWLWYLSMLAPVIGLIQSAAQAMADRYTYLPLIGIFVAIVWSADGLTGMPRRIAGLAAAASLAACTALTFFQVRTWQDPSTLATQALRVTSGNAPAHIMLGAELMKRGQVDDAIGQLEASLRVTDSTEANANLGIAFMARKEPAKALVHFERAAARDPDSAKARYNLGHALTTLTRYEEAYPHLARAVALDPNHATAHLDMAVVLTARGDIAAAVPHLREVLRLDPGNIDVLRNLALIEATHPDPALRNGADAVRLAERARDLTNGQNTVILFTLGAAYAEAGRFDEAQAAVGAGLERAAAEQSAALLVQGRDLLNLFKSRQPFHQPPSGLPGR